MFHAGSVINHSNGRTLCRKHKSRRRPPSSLQVSEKLRVSSGRVGCSLIFFHLETFMGDMIHASNLVAWFLLLNWIELVLCACACLGCGWRFCAGLITEVLVCCFEMLCTALAGRGSLLYFLILLSLGDVSGASVWVCLWQNIVSVYDVVYLIVGVFTERSISLAVPTSG
mmetsp:Transcript_25058/g.46811  ORF Transcript_25058/g.46811 Transcript_25058/m.46811 type:complete len:170 (+) Transcript_25058:179-688(+)